MEKRYRVWCFIVYPESAPDNWEKLISEFHVAWCHSPLHSPEGRGGEELKPHYHVLISYDNQRFERDVQLISDLVHGTKVFHVSNTKGLVRYFLHLDDPDKEQFSNSSICDFCGFDSSSYLKSSGRSRYQMIAEMRLYVQAHHVTEFFQLFDYAAVNSPDDWFPLLCDSCAYIMGEYIKSYRHGRTIVSYDPETGEVVS